MLIDLHYTKKRKFRFFFFIGFSSSVVKYTVGFGNTAAYKFNMSTIRVASMLIDESTAWNTYNKL